MKGNRFFWTAVVAGLLASTGCRSWCEHHGYYPAQPAAGYAAPCCCPCGPGGAGYVAPASGGWAAPAAPAPAPTCPAGCVSPR